MLGSFRAGLRLIDEALSLVFQTQCFVCARPAIAGPLCGACEPSRLIEGSLCAVCGEPTPQPVEACGRCVAAPYAGLSRARSLLWLGDEARTLMHRIKYRRQFELLEIFRPSVRDGFDPAFPRATSAIAVPMHPAKLAARGFNQAELVVGWLHRDLGFPRAIDGLSKVRPTGSQTQLTVEQRARNLARSFAWRGGRRPPARVLLVDDIYTTGATLDAAALALREAGAREVFGWTLLRTPRLLSRSS